MSDLCVIPIVEDCECECKELKEEDGIVSCLYCGHRINAEQDLVTFERLFASLGRAKLKETVIQHYGSVCARCGFSDLRASKQVHVLGKVA